MRAITKVGSNNTIHVQLEGRIDYETQETVKDLIAKTLKNQSAKVVIDMDALEFVGSMGVTNFVHSLIQIQAQSGRAPVYVNVRSEFSKIMKALDQAGTFQFSMPDRNNPLYNQ